MGWGAGRERNSGFKSLHPCPREHMLTGHVPSQQAWAALARAFLAHLSLAVVLIDLRLSFRVDINNAFSLSLLSLFFPHP